MFMIWFFNDRVLDAITDKQAVAEISGRALLEKRLLLGIETPLRFFFEFTEHIVCDIDRVVGFLDYSSPRTHFEQRVHDNHVLTCSKHRTTTEVVLFKASLWYS